MKFILIFVLTNLTNPSDSSILGHKLFNSQAECAAAARQAPPVPEGVKLATFCVSEEDILETKRT